jgi:chaperonin cofactor prefoldin
MDVLKKQMLKAMLQERIPNISKQTQEDIIENIEEILKDKPLCKAVGKIRVSGINNVEVVCTRQLDHAGSHFDGYSRWED